MSHPPQDPKQPPSRDGKHYAPLVERGKRLATIQRSSTEQLRLTWDEFEGHPFVSFRLWHRGTNDQYYPDKFRGITVRLHEFEEFVAGIRQAVDQYVAYQPAPTRKPPARRPHLRLCPPPPPDDDAS